jgi:hypothetical protein
MNDGLAVWLGTVPPSDAAALALPQVMAAIERDVGADPPPTPAPELERFVDELLDRIRLTNRRVRNIGDAGGREDRDISINSARPSDFLTGAARDRGCDLAEDERARAALCEDRGGRIELDADSVDCAIMAIRRMRSVARLRVNGA